MIQMMPTPRMTNSLTFQLNMMITHQSSCMFLKCFLCPSMALVEKTKGVSDSLMCIDIHNVIKV